jgi:hypothetical protein
MGITKASRWFHHRRKPSEGRYSVDLCEFFCALCGKIYLVLLTAKTTKIYTENHKAQG